MDTNFFLHGTQEIQGMSFPIIMTEKNISRVDFFL